MSEVRFENAKSVIQRWDRIFTALSAEPRRQLVVSLRDAPPEGTVSLPESAVNPNAPVDARTLRRELHHQHLPLLADMEVIEWRRDPLEAARGPQFEQVAVVFEALHTNARDLPDELVVGCQRLEAERQFETE